jgi:hypothetical protein
MRRCTSSIGRTFPVLAVLFGAFGLKAGAATTSDRRAIGEASWDSSPLQATRSYMCPASAPKHPCRRVNSWSSTYKRRSASRRRKKPQDLAVPIVRVRRVDENQRKLFPSSVPFRREVKPTHGKDTVSRRKPAS